MALGITGIDVRKVNALLCVDNGYTKQDIRNIHKRTGLNPLVLKDLEDLFDYCVKQLEERGMTVEQLIQSGDSEET